MSTEEDSLVIVLIGDGGVGKTLLVHVFSQKTPKFITEYVPTVLDIYEASFKLGKNQEVKAEIVDTAGQEDYWQVRKTQLKRADIILVCYSTSDYTSLDNAEKRWIPELLELPQKPGFILVGTKDDIKTDLKVDVHDAQRLGKEKKAIDVIQCSSLTFAETQKNEGNVNEVFKAAIKAGYRRAKGKNVDKKGCLLL